MTSKDLDQGPIRCQRLLMRLLRFNAHVRHVPGKELVIADALSRNTLPHTHHDVEKTDEIREFIDSVRASWPTSDTMMDNIRSATTQNRVLQTVAAYTKGGRP